MSRWGGGQIVNMASLAGKKGLAKLAAYSAASAGVIAFHEGIGKRNRRYRDIRELRSAWPHRYDIIRDLGPKRSRR